MEAECKMMVAAVEEENRRLRDELEKLRTLADDESKAFQNHIEILQEQLDSTKERARLAQLEALIEWKIRAAGQMTYAQRKALGSWGLERWHYTAIIERMQREIDSLTIQNRAVKGYPRPSLRLFRNILVRWMNKVLAQALLRWAERALSAPLVIYEEAPTVVPIPRSGAERRHLLALGLRILDGLIPYAKDAMYRAFRVWSEWKLKVCLLRERNDALLRLGVECEAHTAGLVATCDDQSSRIEQLEGAALEAEALLGRPCLPLRSSSPIRAQSPVPRGPPSMAPIVAAREQELLAQLEGKDRNIAQLNRTRQQLEDELANMHAEQLGNSMQQSQHAGDLQRFNMALDEAEAELHVLRAAKARDSASVQRMTEELQALKHEKEALAEQVQNAATNEQMLKAERDNLRRQLTLVENTNTNISTGQYRPKAESAISDGSILQERLAQRRLKQNSEPDVAPHIPVEPHRRAENVALRAMSEIGPVEPLPVPSTVPLDSFSRMDLNGDGVIDRREFNAAIGPSVVRPASPFRVAPSVVLPSPALEQMRQERSALSSVLEGELNLRQQFLAGLGPPVASAVSRQPSPPWMSPGLVAVVMVHHHRGAV